MIKSMTGFGKVSFSDEKLNLDIEIKTINSRYFDFNIRMPFQLNFLEDKISKTVKEYISRGRVDVFIRSKKKNLVNTNIKVDLNQASIMHEALQNIANASGLNADSIKMSDLLRNEDILSFESETLDEKYIEETLISQIRIALEHLVEMRRKEGISLYNDLSSNIDELESKKDLVKSFSENIKFEIREKLLKNIQELIDLSKVDEDRLSNEIVYYADKQDVNEEIIRLESHIIQFREILTKDESVGKKLDFITQEMLRESNTIGSKSSKIDITNIVIDMKTVIEKIKEQVQNVE